MELHPEELGLAREYNQSRPFEPLNAEQVHLIMEKGRALFRWHKAHAVVHNLIGCLVFACVFGADAWVLLGLPRLLMTGGNASTGSILLAGLSTACAHGWLIYSLGVYSLHEGAAHNAIFVGSGVPARAAQFLARNVCRISQADPDYYAPCHMGHHAKFGTEDDPEFLNFVLPHRLWLSLLPFATVINFSDFIVHRPPTYTRDRIISALVSGTYHSVYGWFMYRAFGPMLPLLVVALVLHVGFYCDRLRQFTEHNLMPLENRVGARNLGLGFWGLLIGGGPWGQPCHLSHHLVASLPWYQQIVLHRYFKRLLAPRQREQFLVAPFVGYPKLFWRIVRDTNRFARNHSTLAATQPGSEGR